MQQEEILGYAFDSKGLITYHNRMYIPNIEILKQMIMYEHHNRPYVGHPGYQKMIIALRKQLLWMGMKKEVAYYLATLLERQQVKVVHQSPT